jgi:hypothetical protein
MRKESCFGKLGKAWDSFTGSRPSRTTTAARFRPCVEALEERTVLSLTSLSPDVLASTRISFGTSLAMHIHVELHLTIDNQAVTIPANIGVSQTDATLIHTHDTTGLIHIESPFVHDFVLEDFLTIWGQQGAEGHQVQEEIDNARMLSIQVNGTPASLDGLVLHDHDTIDVQVTTTNDAFLAQMYHVLLHRNPDLDGMRNFQTFLATGGTRDQVVHMIVDSTEYRTNVIEQLYHTLLQRDADSSGLNAFLSFFASGGTVEQAQASILGSDEFFQRMGGTDSSWLQAVYTNVLDRGVDAAGGQSWLAALAGGSSHEQVAQAIIGSSEEAADRVQSYYQLFYHRDVDDSGRAAFVAAIANGMTDAQMVASIVGSDEYFSKVPA